MWEHRPLHELQLPSFCERKKEENLDEYIGRVIEREEENLDDCDNLDLLLN
jgi:hypothetical protein